MPVSKKRLAFQQLEAFCKGELSFRGLKRRVAAIPKGTLQAHEDDENTILHVICQSYKVTLKIVKCVVELYPAAVKHSGSGPLPLHFACVNIHCPNNVIEYLVAKYPEALAISWAPIGLPLHCAVRRMEVELGKGDQEYEIVRDHIRLGLGLVRFLVEASPEALTNQDNIGRETPMLKAVQRDDISLELVKLLTDEDCLVLRIRGGHSNVFPLCKLFENHTRCPSLDVVDFFLKNAIDTLEERGDHDPTAGAVRDTPFHVVCSNEHVTLGIIQMFVKARRSILEASNYCGNLPLHSVCLNTKLPRQDHVSIVKYMAHEYPESITWQNDYGMTPLYYSAACEIESVQFLVEQEPSTLHLRAFDNWLPFHRACSDGSFKTVQYLLNFYPEVVADLTASGQFPLYLAATSSRDVATKVNLLLQKRPESARAHDLERSLPLHAISCCTGDTLGAVKQIFNAYPEAIHTKDSHGRLPLHLACNHNVSAETLHFLYTQLPYATRARSNSGRLPIHEAAAKVRPWHRVEKVVELDPEALKEETQAEGLPLHVAVSNGASLKLVKYLVDSYPQSLCVHNESVGLPLHCAKTKDIFIFLLQHRYGDPFRFCQTFFHAALTDNELKDKNTIVDHFVYFLPESAWVTDGDGSLPFHLAMAVPIANEPMTKLHHTCPDAMFTQNKRGWLPLHFALRYNDSLDAIKLLLGWFPGGIEVCDKGGNTPLHIACRHGSSPDIISYLVEQSPQAVSVMDGSRNTPLHAACRHGASTETIRCLVTADEATVWVTDEKKEHPLHKACRGGHLDAVNYFISEYPALAEVQNSTGALPLYLLCQRTGKQDLATMDSPEFVETIWRLLLSYPEAIPSPAHWT